MNQLNRFEKARKYVNASSLTGMKMKVWYETQNARYESVTLMYQSMKHG